MRQPPIELGRQQCERVQQIIETFLVDGPADRQQRYGARGVGTIATIVDVERRRKASGVDSVIDEVDGCGVAADIAQMSGVERRARCRPRGCRELLALLPFWKRPDVLGMRRAAPREAADQGCVSRDRRRRMQEMRVHVGDVLWQLRREYDRLAEAARAVAIP